MLPVSPQVGAGRQGRQLAIAHKQQPRLGHDGQQPLDHRNIQAIIRLFPRHHLRRQGQSQRPQHSLHDFHLQQAGIIFALAKLEQARDTPAVIARHSGGIQPQALLFQVVHAHRRLSQIPLNRLPVPRPAQLPQDNRQPVIGEIRVADTLPRHLLQGLVRLRRPIADGQLPMITPRNDMRQPNRGHPAPTQAGLQPVAGQVAIQYVRQVQSHHHMQQQDQVIYAFGREGQFGGHSPSLSGNSVFLRRLREW